MITVTRFNGTIIYINAEMIRTIEGTPDTVITLTDNTKMIVRESPETVAEKAVVYQRLVKNPQLTPDLGE
jgi:flagellar protein FlbD